jgi:GTPase Era involved in 16S rRNA processing
MPVIEEILTRATSSVPNPSLAQRSILAKLTALQARLDEGVLRVAVLGQFKRGKSTLLNALLGLPLLPSGVIPVTAIPTFVGAGAGAKARITFADGKAAAEFSREADIQSALEQHISEAQNPRNCLQVAKVEIEFPSDFLKRGVMAIDTPGVGSTFLHNTETAEAVLGECDAALFVLSADPPITEVEVKYLRDVQKLIPKIFFILNKVDLLDASERSLAEKFLADVLAEQAGISPPVRIFCVSARRGVRAKQEANAALLAESGIKHLQDVLADELAREKRAIVLSVVRMRAAALVEELLFQGELEHKALLLPQDELKRKAAIFEESASGFENERQSLSDVMAIDRSRLLKELNAQTDLLWKKTQRDIGELLETISAKHTEEKEARDQLEAALTERFEEAFPAFIEVFKAKLQERLAVHRERADALLRLVRQTAANLMEIAVSLPRSEEAFEVKRTPYWVAAEATVSLIGLSKGALSSLMPKNMRERQLYRNLTADAEKAVVNNISNLEWAVKRNVEDAFVHFETALSEQLDKALQMTREAFQLAIERHATRSEAISSYVKGAEQSLAAVRKILAELQDQEQPPNAHE